MSLVVDLVLLAIGGLAVGAMARFALPGRDPMSIRQTIGVGLVGALVGGVPAFLLLDSDVAVIVAASLGATVVMYFVRRSRGGGLLDPGKRPD